MLTRALPARFSSKLLFKLNWQIRRESNALAMTTYLLLKEILAILYQAIDQ
jgi:hypothetical protein